MNVKINRERFRKILFDKEISIAMLAAKANILDETIYRACRRGHRMRYDTLLRVSQALGIDPREIAEIED